jgi:hypothetical protein
MEKKIYRLYIDEVGKSSYPKVDNSSDFDDQYFALCGIVIEEKEQVKLNEAFRSLKLLVIKDIDDIHTVSLHRRDIVSKKGPFKTLISSEEEIAFNTQFLDIISKIDFKIIFVGLDKISHKGRYSTPAHPYHYMMNIMIEKYVGLLEDLKSTGDVLAESTNKKEDKVLQDVFEFFINSGSSYCSSQRIKSRITSKNIKFKTKEDGVSGVELADLLALPVLFEILNTKKIRVLNPKSFNVKVIEAISNKYYKYGKKIII